MPLGANSYGKSEIRLVKVGRDRGLRDLTVDISLQGDFEAVHTRGDNTGLVATDTMRNVVYAFAADTPLDSLPAFGTDLVEHFLEHERVSGATARLREHPWQGLPGSDHAFQRGAGGTRVHEVSGGPWGLRHAGGVEDLLVLRTAGSAFAGFDRDRFTTLPETDDRILATAVKARWDHRDDPAEEGWARVRDTLLEAFADHHSPSVQFTLHRMGEAVLDAHADVDCIHLTLPNRHHLPYDVSRFGIEDRGEVFHATTEPFGLIEATVERS